MSDDTRGSSDVGESPDQLIDDRDGVLSTLLDQSHDCIKLLDHQGRIVFVNREGARLMEGSAPAALIGQRWSDRWPESLRPELDTALAAARQGKVSRFSGARPGPDQALRWWDVTLSPVRSHTGAVSQFLAIARDTTSEVSERQRAAAISAEMRHRLKNALTIAAGIVTISARARPEVQPFAREVTARFGQLAAVQDLLLDPAREKHLADIVPLLASAYGDASLLRFGAPPDVQLADSAMQALALSFGELATNSLKYGALRHGRPVDVDADIAETMLRLSWREPTEFGTPRDGAQGLGLIERLVAASGGRVERTFDDGVFLARLWFPILH